MKQMNTIMASMVIAFTMITSMQADDAADILFPTIAGAAIGGAAGGGRGAGIGAAVGLGTGALISSSRNRSSRRYRGDDDTYGEIRALRAENKSLARENKDLGKEITKLEKQAEKLEEKIAALETELENCVNPDQDKKIEKKSKKPRN